MVLKKLVGIAVLQLLFLFVDVFLIWLFYTVVCTGVLRDE